MYILNICDNASMMQTILFIKKIINIIFIAVPLILALLFTIDLAKNVLVKDDTEARKNLKLGIKRIIYSIVLMFVPLLINTFMSMINSYSKIADCYTKATDENVEKLYEQEQKRDKQEQEKRDKERQGNKQKVDKEKEKEKKRQKSVIEIIAEKLKEIEKKDNDETPPTEVCQNCPNAKKLVQVAEKLAWPKGTPKSKSNYPGGGPTPQYKAAINRNFKGKFYWSNASRKGASCDIFIGTVVRESGYDKDFPAGLGRQVKHMNKSKKWVKVNCDGRISCLQPGDILYSKHNKNNGLNNGHIYMYIGNNRTAEASAKDFYGRINKFSDRRNKPKVRYVNVYRAVK